MLCLENINCSLYRSSNQNFCILYINDLRYLMYLLYLCIRSATKRIDLNNLWFLLLINYIKRYLMSVHAVWRVYGISYLIYRKHTKISLSFQSLKTRGIELCVMANSEWIIVLIVCNYPCYNKQQNSYIKSVYFIRHL